MKLPDRPPEPWMIEFVKGRHSQEEWDAFYAYMEAGPVKRWVLRLISLLHSVIFERF